MAERTGREMILRHGFAFSEDASDLLDTILELHA